LERTVDKLRQKLDEASALTSKGKLKRWHKRQGMVNDLCRQLSQDDVMEDPLEVSPVAKQLRSYVIALIHSQRVPKLGDWVHTQTCWRSSPMYTQPTLLKFNSEIQCRCFCWVH